MVSKCLNAPLFFPTFKTSIVYKRYACGYFLNVSSLGTLFQYFFIEARLIRRFCGILRVPQSNESIFFSHFLNILLLLYLTTSNTL